MILDALTSLVKAVDSLIRTAWPARKKEPRLERRHFWTVDMDTPVSNATTYCLYCRTPFTKSREAERCPFFT